MILIWPFFVRKGFNGITLFPFIILSEKNLANDKVLVNHEKIHLRQQIELLVVFFYLIYITEFFLRYLKYRNGEVAYRFISFEREAYNNEQDFSYLKQRKFWSFLKYY